MALEPSRLSDFKLFGPLGSGATSRVVEAVHTASGRRVAIKLLESPEDELAPELRERFAREALVLAGLTSRHVGRILGFGFERGQPFLVLEHLEGETIDARLKREGPLSLRTLTPWIAQIIVGMRDCHAVRVVHRDLKPGNIFLQKTAGEPIVKLIDFGLARAKSGQGSLTSTQHVLGSVGYMSPEQFVDAKSVGPSADIYAVGCVIFRCLSGRLPFMSRSLDAVVQMKSERDAPLLSSMEGCPQINELDWFVAKAMARRAEDRFENAKDMLDAWWHIAPMLEPPRVGGVQRHDSIPILIGDFEEPRADAQSLAAEPTAEDDDVDSGWGDAPPETRAPVTDPMMYESGHFHTIQGVSVQSMYGTGPESGDLNNDTNERPSGTSLEWDDIPTQRNLGVVETLVAQERAIARKREPG
jgi:eukaryotic-like serine/threonine-protein kinase